MSSHLIRLRRPSPAIHPEPAAPHPQHARASAAQVAQALGSPLQAKLALGAPDDAQEREADAVAERVMRQPDGAGERVQRLCAECEQEEQPLQRQAAADAQPGAATVPAGIAARIEARRGAGEPLPAGERAFFEPRLGSRLDDVRLHHGGEAEALSERLSARAFTVGKDVFLGRGEYRPGSAEGRRLLAHELGHVLQQRGAQAALLRRLSISQHLFSKGSCGERNVQWVFSLDAAAATDGYIVQKVVPTEVTMSCNVLAGATPAVEVYWEAWKIKKGDKVDWTTTRDAWTDGSKYPAHPNGSGSQVTPGEVKYFPIAKTGDLGDFGVAPGTANGWGPGKVKRSGDLPSTASEPSWWKDTPTEGPATREASSSWSCCDPDPKKHTSEVKASP